VHWSSCPRQRPINPHRCGRVRVRVRVPAGRSMSLCVRAWVAARLLAPAVGHANGYFSNSFRPPLTQAVAVFEHLGQTPDPAIKKVAPAAANTAQAPEYPSTPSTRGC
jgi:hypothetical protein